jgi:hypothetical protein
MDNDDNIIMDNDDNIIINSNNKIIKLRSLKKNLKKEIKKKNNHEVNKINHEINKINHEIKKINYKIECTKNSRLIKKFLLLVPDSNDLKFLIKKISCELIELHDDDSGYTLNLEIESYTILFTNDLFIRINIGEAEAFEYEYNDPNKILIEFNGDLCELINNKLIICNSSKNFLKYILKSYKIKETKENLKKLLQICQILISHQTEKLSENIIFKFQKRN